VANQGFRNPLYTSNQTRQQLLDIFDKISMKHLDYASNVSFQISNILYCLLSNRLKPAVLPGRICRTKRIDLSKKCFPRFRVNRFCSLDKFAINLIGLVWSRKLIELFEQIAKIDPLRLGFKPLKSWKILKKYVCESNPPPEAIEGILLFSLKGLLYLLSSYNPPDGIGQFRSG
jgi:hypothetical protein